MIPITISTTAAWAVRTVQLVNDLKNQLGNTTKTEYALPQKPVKPQKDIEGEGDNRCAQYFTYQRDGNYYVITGLTREGAQKKELIVPYQVNGLYVKSFAASVFSGNDIIESVTIQENIRSVSDNSFKGCANLKKIVLKHAEPSQITVGYGLLNGTSSAICVSELSVSAFKNNYFWGHYTENIYGTESFV